MSTADTMNFYLTMTFFFGHPVLLKIFYLLVITLLKHIRHLIIIIEVDFLRLMKLPKNLILRKPFSKLFVYLSMIIIVSNLAYINMIVGTKQFSAGRNGSISRLLCLAGCKSFVASSCFTFDRKKIDTDVGRQMRQANIC